MKALAIDFGGTHATCGLVEDRTILAHETIDTDRAKSLRAVLPQVVDVFHRLANTKGLSLTKCTAVAVGFAGLVDSRAGRVLATNEKYEDAKEIDLVAWSKQTLGLPLRIENDTRMALLGEFYAGAARGFTEIVMMTLGTGIGGVAMIDGKLLRGKHFQAGCLGGHFPVLFTGRKCTCGGIGCAEAEAAGWSLPLVVKDWPGASQSALSKYPHVGFKELFEEAGRGDSVAVTIRDRCEAVNRHPGQVGYSHSPPQEVRDGEFSVRADPGEEGEGQAAHAAACAARERQRQSDLPLFRGVQGALLHLEETL